MPKPLEHPKCIELVLYGITGWHQQHLHLGPRVDQSDHRAVNLVLFDLRQELDSPALTSSGESEVSQLEEILAWCGLLYLTSRAGARVGLSSQEEPRPHILIVGTHCDGLSQDQDTQHTLVSGQSSSPSLSYRTLKKTFWLRHRKMPL